MRKVGEGEQARDPERTESRRGRILVTSILLYPEQFGEGMNEHTGQGD